MTNKVGIIIPFRNRHSHLPIFIETISKNLNNSEIPFEIIIVEQDNAKQFNRGMLLNIGYTYAKKMSCKYVIFHDVDMVPIDVDYSYDDKPIHLATNFVDKQREIFEEYFGGVTLFPMKIFELIDGYSNKYWDWGYEDTDLLHRCVKHNVELDTIKIPNMGSPTKALKFNGIDSFVKGRNIFETDTNLSFIVSFYPDNIICDHNREVDDYTVFSIPGYDTSISYNSFSRYSFLTFDVDKKALYLNTKIKTNYKTDICVTIDNTNKVIKFYQDAQLIGEVNITKPLLQYNYERFFYIGVGNPNRVGDERFFKGYLTSFIATSKVLTDDEILDKETIKQSDLLIHYDVNHIENYTLTDLSGNNYNGKIERCEIVDLEFDKYKNIKIPHRRKSTFDTLPHEENGFGNNKWKKSATRWNQLRFHNEVYLSDDLIHNDGLSTLTFVEHGVEKINKNVTKIVVGL